MSVQFTSRLFGPRSVAAAPARTGASGLEWLNRVQAVAKGHFDAETMTVTYPEIFEMR